MQLHRGRMIDHIQLRARDLAATKRFYKAVLEVIGVDYDDQPDHLSADELWIDVGEPATHIHLAFQAKDRAMVQRFHEAGLAAGGRDNGGPGEREYHPGYYAAFLLDPDGNNIEAVFHGPHERSADSVVLTWDE
ncbi:VOC family protein [Caulobacter endophyticus]|uniref:VOC family protein n=1 Tax=Caulobacter endophyticus TaxID=2172652 RepID=UPI00240F515B|nr:VOC family protein [Caulobacter endophyticus]MDG2527732.1 VOC family protein [Caulobacter endophyticus]